MSTTKVIKGERKRESESETQQERNRDRLKFQINNKTPHPKISKFSKPNRFTQNDYPALKNGIYNTEKE